MSKAALVIDMPENCGRCILKSVGEYSDIHCHITDKPISVGIENRPNWCPLIPQPAAGFGRGCPSED